VYVLSEIERTEKFGASTYKIQLVTCEDEKCDLSGRNISSELAIRVYLFPSKGEHRKLIISRYVDNIEIEENCFNPKKFEEDLEKMREYYNKIICRKISDGIFLFEYNKEAAVDLVDISISVNCEYCDAVHDGNCEKYKLILSSSICICSSYTSNLKVVDSVIKNTEIDKPYLEALTVNKGKVDELLGKSSEYQDLINKYKVNREI
jgi:hypothetical protein